MKCRICDNPIGNKTFEVREMMYGLKDKFLYFQCSECGCLQIAEFPENISKYYPSNYYSFKEKKKKNELKKRLWSFGDEYAVFRKNLVGKIFFSLNPNPSLQMLSHIKLTKDNSILDVGCGSGTTLLKLSDIGFKNLTGIDPYIGEDIFYANNVKVLKQTIHQTEGKWDLIMFHHSFEHIPEQLEALCSASNLLNDNGVCLIRIPTVSSFVWNNYGVNWVQLDAPRHFFLHSIKSFSYLAEKTGLKIDKIIYDSTHFQFWGSEQYMHDIPLTAPNSYHINPSKSSYSKKDISELKRKAKELNRQNQGDCCAIYLTKPQ